LFLNEAVERKSFKSVGSRFHARCAATEKAVTNRATLPWYEQVTMLDERSDDREGMSEADVSRLAMIIFCHNCD